MASIPATLLFFISIISITLSSTLSASVVSDLVNLHPPPEFNTTIHNNCVNNPSLRYCNSTSPPSCLLEIFKFTIVSSHLCNESKNPNCVESFPKIDLSHRPNAAQLYMSFSFFWKYCPLTILSIDLSNNSLTGIFPSDILQCTQIQALDMSHNQLSGDFPVQNFSLLSNLTSLNLSYNKFSEMKISDTEFFKRFNSSSFVHSGLLPNHRRFKIMAAILLIVFPVFLILMIVLLGWVCFQRPDFLPKFLQRKHKFTVPTLKAATNGFSRKNLVGRGEGVEIYKGTLRDGTEVRIELYTDDISRDKRGKFVEECKVLVQLCHKNIVQVLGRCNHRRLRAVIAEWTSGENVEMWLSGSAPSWKHRLKILMGVLDGMCYLQDQWPEVGYNLRTGSLLLSEGREPLISRFKVGDENSNTKNIYKFGVFLLEMVANRRPREEFRRGEADFVAWMKMHYPGDARSVIDERMKKNGNMVDQATQVIGLGLACTDLSTNRQPSLVQIYNIMSGVYESMRSEGHKRMQSR